MSVGSSTGLEIRSLCWDYLYKGWDTSPSGKGISCYDMLM